MDNNIDGNGGRECKSTSKSNGYITLCSAFIAAIVIGGFSVAHISQHTILPPHIHVASFYVHNFSVSHSHLRGNFQVGFNMSNPNKKTKISVGVFRVSIRHRHVELARVSLHKKEGTLELKRMMETNVMVSKVVNKSPKDYPKVFARIEKEWNGTGTRVVSFSLTIFVIVRFHAGDSLSEPKILSFACDHLAVVFSGKNRVDGELGGGVGGGGVTHDCHVMPF